MQHVSTVSSWPMTLRAVGGPPGSQLKCQTSRPPSISHSKEECPCAADGNSGWVPTMVHSPTRISNCFIELVGCGGSFACSFMFITLMYSRVLNIAKHALRPHLPQEGPAIPAYEVEPRHEPHPAHWSTPRQRPG